MAYLDPDSFADPPRTPKRGLSTLRSLAHKGCVLWAVALAWGGLSTATQAQVMAPGSPSEVPRAWAQQCEGQLPPTSVTVTVTPSRILYDHPGAAELTRYFGNKPGQIALGRTTAQPKISSRIGAKALAGAGPGQPGCLRPQMDITLSFDPQRVSIAREIPKDSCGYRHVLAHELEHVRINQDGLKEMAVVLKQVLSQRYGNQVFYGDPSYWQAQLRQDVQTWRPWLQAELERRLFAQHHALDSPEEYAKNRLACGGELARLLDRLGPQLGAMPGG